MVGRRAAARAREVVGLKVHLCDAGLEDRELEQVCDSEKDAQAKVRLGGVDGRNGRAVSSGFGSSPLRESDGHTIATGPHSLHMVPSSKSCGSSVSTLARHETELEAVCDDDHELEVVDERVVDCLSERALAHVMCPHGSADSDDSDAISSIEQYKVYAPSECDPAPDLALAEVVRAPCASP